MAEINVVPYIDVMLVLLVIFMIATPTPQQAIKISMPKKVVKTPPRPNSENKVIEVSLDAKGNYYLKIGGKDYGTVNIEKIRAEVSSRMQNPKKPPVVVRANPTLGYGKVVKVMAILRASNAPTISLVQSTTRQPSNKGKQKIK